MAANTNPIYSRQGDVQSVAGIGNPTAGLIVGPTANTAQDGTSSSTSMAVAFQADATNGSYVQKMRFRAVGSPAATVARIFICSVTGALTMGTTNTASNTFLYEEISLPSVTLSQTIQSPTFEVPLGFALAAGYRLLVSFGTSTGAAGTGYSVVTIAGDY